MGPRDKVESLGLQMGAFIYPILLGSCYQSRRSTTNKFWVINIAWDVAMCQTIVPPPPPNCNPLWPTYKQFWSPIESWCSVCWKHRSYTRAYSGHEVSLKKQNMKKLESRPLLKNVWEKTAEISCHLINAGHILLLQSILPWNERVHFFIGPISMLDLLQK